jgi:hypothetical protein
MTIAKILEFDTDFSARIYHNQDVEQPFQDDEAVHVVVLHRRYIDPAHGECGSSPDAVAAWEQENAGE